MSQYARYARSSWAECAICGLDFPQTEMVRHYKYKVLVDQACADELAASDFMEALRLPENERPNPTQQQVPDQGSVTGDYKFIFGSSPLDSGKMRMTAEPRVGQPPWVDVEPPPAPEPKIDLVHWDTWVGGPSFIGSTYNDPVYDPDTLYLSFGPGWVNIDWNTMQVGQRIQIKSPDGTILYQDWVALDAFVSVGPGGHVNVGGAGGPLTGLSAGTPIQCVWL